MPKQKQKNCRLIANKEGRRIAKCSEIYQKFYCPKFNVKKIRDILQICGFKSLVSRLGLGTFKSRSRLDFLLKVSVSSRSCFGLASVSPWSRFGLASISPRSRLGLVPVSSRSRLDLVSVSKRQCLVSSRSQRFWPRLQLCKLRTKMFEKNTFVFKYKTSCFFIFIFYLQLSLWL